MGSLKILLLIAVFGVAIASYASVYKTITSKGQTLFSDAPPTGSQSQEVILPPVNTINMTMPQPSILTPASPPELSAQPDYQLTIEQPADGSTIRGTQAISVIANVKPPLQPEHKLDILLNGTLKAKPQRSSHFILKSVYRGKHQMTVRIVNPSGKAITTTHVTVYVFRPFIQNAPSQKSNSIKPEK